VASLDLLTVGRVGVDLYPEQPDPLKDVRTFARSLGGTATNVAVGGARLGRRAGVLTKVGPDPFGQYVREALAGFGRLLEHVNVVVGNRAEAEVAVGTTILGVAGGRAVLDLVLDAAELIWEPVPG
jgi:sugar/nucleoside kinase (ribokinase family)